MLIQILPDQDAFHTVERSSLDSYSLSFPEKREERKRDALVQQPGDVFNLFAWDGRSESLASYYADDPVGAKDSEPVLIRAIYLDERVPRK